MTTTRRQMLRLLSGVSAIMTYQAAAAARVSADGDENIAKPLVRVVFFSSEFCGACHVLAPRLDALAEGFASQPVAFITFHQTWRVFNGDRLRARADAAGLMDIYDAHKGATGFALLVGPEGQVLDRLTIRDDLNAMATKIVEAGQRVSA